MEQKLQKKLKKKLEAEKKKLTKDLASFAKKDPKIKGNWKTRFPFFSFGRASVDENAEKREEYENRLPIEHTLELRLRDIKEALEKIGTDKYGACEQCKGEIEQKRLEVAPEAKMCLKCGKTQSR